MKPLINWLTVCVFWLAFCPIAPAEPKQPVYTLEQAIETALANNPELGVMQARIEQADAQLGQAMASFYPQIKTSLSYQYSNNPAQAFSMLIAERRLNLPEPISTIRVLLRITARASAPAMRCFAADRIIISGRRRNWA